MVPGWTYHATPAAPDTVGTIMLKELDDIELVVVGADVGLVQGAVVILVDLQQAAQPRLTPGQRLGMGGCRAVPAGMQRGLQGKLGLPLCQQGRDCPGTLPIPPAHIPPSLPQWVPQPHPHLGTRRRAQGAQPIDGGRGLLLGGSFQGCQGGAPGIILLSLLCFLAPAIRLLRRGCVALGGHD